MSDITLVSQNYSDDHYLGITKGDGSVFVDGPIVFKDGIYMPGGSPFITGPEFNRLSAFVSGPDAQVQGKLTASTGINLNNNTISVNTATSVGTSNLPVTAAAVNTKLSNYVNSVSSPDGSITVSKSGSSVTLKANGGSGGNYVPLGSYGSYQQTGALPIGTNSTASGYHSMASGYHSMASDNYSTACGDYSTASGSDSTACGYNSMSEYSYCSAYGRNSTASSNGSTACGSNSTASGGDSMASGYNSTASGYDSTSLGAFSAASGDYSTASGGNSTASGGSSTSLGVMSTASGDLAQTIGSYGRNANDCCVVIAAIKGKGSDCGGSIDYVTQLYLIPKGSPLANQYEGGEACLGYVTTDGSWNKIASGTKKLSELLNNNVNTFAPKLTETP